MKTRTTFKPLLILLPILFFGCSSPEIDSTTVDAISNNEEAAVASVPTENDIVADPVDNEASDYRPYIIIAYNSGSPDEMSEDWTWFISEIGDEMNRSSDINTIMFELYEDQRVVDIQMPGGDPIVYDITEWIEGHDSGYVFFSKDSDPIYFPYSHSTETIKAAKAYFGIE